MRGYVVTINLDEDVLAEYWVWGPNDSAAAFEARDYFDDTVSVNLRAPYKHESPLDFDSELGPEPFRPRQEAQ